MIAFVQRDLLFFCEDSEVVEATLRPGHEVTHARRPMAVKLLGLCIPVRLLVNSFVRLKGFTGCTRVILELWAAF